MMTRRIGIGLLSGMFAVALASAGEDIRPLARRAMPLTQQGGTARAMSMGSAVVAVPQGSASLLWNPAGLGEMEPCLEGGLHHNSGLGDASDETAVFGMPVGRLGGLAASIQYVDNGTFEGRDDVGNNTSSYSASTLGGSLGWGKRLVHGLSAGAALKANRQTLAGESYVATALDLGLMWRPMPLLSFGLTHVNLGNKVAGKQLDSGWQAGAAYNLRPNLLLAAATELKPSGFDRLELGAEGWVHPRVALRGGFVHHFENAQLSGLTGMTAGIGVKIRKDLALDYAYLPFGELGVSQRVSLTYKFLCSDKDSTSNADPASPK